MAQRTGLHSVIHKYNTQGPRYTSYPTALEFSPLSSQQTLTNAFDSSWTDAMSVYVHIPFCHSMCYYCGCNKIVTRHQHKADSYLDALAKEMAMTTTYMQAKQVEQCHLGGGTPTFLTIAQMQRLVALLRAHYHFSEDAQWSIEIDPRSVDTDYLTELFGLGFRRISLGVQDVDPDVQIAINREQDTQHVQALITHAKCLGFTSVNVDLIYGLPHQTPQTFAETLDVIIVLNPERISLFSYAHLPTRFAAQRKIKDAWLPDTATKAELMELAISTLCAKGYVQIGMDHFAKPDDELAIAQQNGQLHRNFQGYTTHKHLDMLGLGVSAISFIGDQYRQNTKVLHDYCMTLNQDKLPSKHGVVLSEDDLLRRAVIMSLMCNMYVDVADIEQRFGIVFTEYFAAALALLNPFVEDKLVTMTNTDITIHTKAKLLVRSVAMCFDAYIGDGNRHNRFSRVI